MPTKLIIAITVFSLLFIGGAYVLLAGDNKPSVPIVSYAVSDKDRPIVEAKETSADLGTLKVSDEKTKVFTIRNIGNKILQLSNFTTSCGCTSVQLITQGKLSNEFSMHAQSDYVAGIAPGSQAQVKVTYRPYVMPVYGEVEREAYISTNDPSVPKLVFKVKSIVK